jgi:hypothetical protein
LNSRRRLVLALGALALILFVVSMVVLALHGMAEGYEHGYDVER